MLRRDFLKTAALFASRGASQNVPRLNVVLILTSDRAIFEQLAHDGIQFTRAYSVCPSPEPAKAALLSGCYPYALRASQSHPAAAIPNFHFLSGAGIRLDRTALAPDTLAIATAAHGEIADQPFENSAHVPLVSRYPGKLAAASSDALIPTVDLMPTILGFCGVDIPGEVQGRDLSRWISNGAGERPESVYCTGKRGTTDEWRMVVRGLDKLVVDKDLNVTHLYNLGQDPSEMENLARDKTQVLTRDALEALLGVWMRRTGDGLDPSGLRKRGL